MEKYISWKQQPQESWSIYTNIRLNRLLHENVTRDNNRHFIMIRGSIYREDTTIIMIYVLNKRTPQYIKQKVIEITGEADNSAIIDYNTHFQ